MFLLISLLSFGDGSQEVLYYVKLRYCRGSMVRMCVMVCGGYDEGGRKKTQVTKQFETQGGEAELGTKRMRRAFSVCQLMATIFNNRLGSYSGLHY